MSQSALNRDKLIQLLDGNPGLIVTIIDSFLDDCPDYMEEIRTAIATGNAEALKQEAHGLKGAAGSIRAAPTSDAAATLEEIGHSGDLEGAEEALETLEHEIDRLTEVLVDLRDECQEKVRDE